MLLIRYIFKAVNQMLPILNIFWCHLYVIQTLLIRNVFSGHLYVNQMHIFEMFFEATSMLTKC